MVYKIDIGVPNQSTFYVLASSLFEAVSHMYVFAEAEVVSARRLTCGVELNKKIGDTSLRDLAKELESQSPTILAMEY